MTRDEALTIMEDKWRAAALAGTPQWIKGVCFESNSQCAWTAVWRDVPEPWRSLEVKAWRCPECIGHTSVSVIGAMVHLNDAHRWTFDRLANKFREALADGERLAAMETP